MPPVPAHFPIMKLTPATAVAALAVIGAGGFFAGRLTSPGVPGAAPDGSPEVRNVRSGARESISENAAGNSADRRQRPDRGARATVADGAEARKIQLANIVRGENALDRNRALLDYIDQLAPGDFQDAVAYFRGLGITNQRMGEYSLLLTAWGEADPVAALAYAKDNTGGGFARDTVLTSWATRDPQAALAWANANFEGEGANPYMPGIIRGISATDPAQATALLTAMPRSGERGEGLDFMLPHLLNQGTDATRAWIDNLGDDSLMNGAMLRVADQLAEADPAATASWLAAHPGEATQRRMDDVYGVWAKNDPPAAIASFRAMPDGDARRDALRGVITNVATRDPQQAVGLMNAYPADVTGKTVERFVWHSFGEDPVLAVSQISRVPDEKDRDQMYRRTLGYWMDRDAPAANQWLATNPVSENVRNQLAQRAADRARKQ